MAVKKILHLNFELLHKYKPKKNKNQYMTIFWSPSVKLVLYLRQIEKKSKKIKSYNWFLEYSK